MSQKRQPNPNDPSKQKPRFRLDLEALDDDGLEMVGLRRLLKRMLRGYGFRCLSATELRDDKTTEEGVGDGG